MLQNDWMARNKGAHPAGPACLVHCLIYTAALTAAYAGALASTTLPATLPQTAPAAGLVTGMVTVVSPERILLFTVVVFLTHWAIDGLRLAERWGVLLRQSPGPPVRTVVDQTMHILVLALASVI